MIPIKLWLINNGGYMPRIIINKEISFSFKEANNLVPFMEQIADYIGHKTGKTAYQVMDDYDVLNIFHKLRHIVWNKYDKALLKEI
jgi:hypothetical protein